MQLLAHMHLPFMYRFYLAQFSEHLGSGYRNNIYMTGKARGKGRGTLKCAESPI